MNYKDRLYEKYVSQNKADRYKMAGGVEVQALLWDYQLSGWLKRCSREAKVVEIGCGRGDFLAYLQRRGFLQVVGVDLSREQVELGCAAGRPITLGDAHSFLSAEHDNSLGMVIALDVLEHLRRDEMVDLLMLAHRKLVPGGALLVQMPNGDSPFVGSVYFADATHEQVLTAESARHLLRASGFTEPSFHEIKIPPYRPSWAARWLGWQLLRTMIYLAHRIETGSKSSGYYTRVFRFIAFKSTTAQA